MSVGIHQPEIEALIEQWMASGAFQDVEEVLLRALRSAPLLASTQKQLKRTGVELVAAMQAMPYKDIEMELSCPEMLVSRTFV